jgi:hypothetical protein
MTGEPSPAGPSRSSGARPELRASHEDRDRAAEILRVAAGDGRLTAAELDERLEAALTARTTSELALLTADLPAVAGQSAGAAPQAKDLVRIDALGGNARRVGGWVVPRRMEIRVVGGTVKLDLTEAVITGPALRIEAKVRGGNLILVTKPGIEIDTDGVAVLGGKVKVQRSAASKQPAILKVEVSGEVLGGTMVARRSRRALWRSLLRRPGLGTELRSPTGG